MSDFKPVRFLYNLWQNYFSPGFYSVIDFMNTDLGGHSLMDLFFGVGLPVILGWIVTKWVVPS